MVFGYDVFDDTLSYDSALLEESLALWKVLRINMRWQLKTHWCVIPRICFLIGTIPPCYSSGVRTLSFLSPLRYRSYQIAHWYWHTLLCGVHQTRGLPWYNYLGHWNKIGRRVGDWPHSSMVCLSGQQSNIHVCGSPPFLPVDSIVPTIITLDYHS